MLRNFREETIHVSSECALDRIATLGVRNAARTGDPRRDVVAIVSRSGVCVRIGAPQNHKGGHMSKHVFTAVHGLGLGALVGLSILAAACGAAPDGTTEASEQAGDEVAIVAQTTVTGWTPYTSEEFPPISCDNSSLFSAVQCSGSNCDNTRAYCTPTGGTRGSSSWTTYFSEEGTSWRYCGANQWVTGLACTGNYCDNISLQCTTMTGISWHNCYWTGWVSEEGGGLLSFGANYFAVGAQCSGGNCDNKRFYVCQP